MKIVISLFDGISCGAQAIKNLGEDVVYLASEIEQEAIKVSQDKHPNIIRMGDVRSVNVTSNSINWEGGTFSLFDGQQKHKIHLLLAGSPCQGFSKAGKQKNLGDERSGLYREFLRIKNEIEMYQHRVNYLLENVPMSNDMEDEITHDMKQWPVKINSKHYTGQNRKRLYWSNLLPTTTYGEKDECKGEGVSILNILEDTDFSGVWTHPRGWNKGGAKITETMPCITTSSWQHNQKVVKKDGTLRMFTPIECERAQGLPDNYTSCLTDNQRYKVLGNCWTVPVIEKIIYPCFN